jgi:hypothetical protein
MLDLYFGLDATGFERATTFHPVFGRHLHVCLNRIDQNLGPFLMVTFACLSNTLLLTGQLLLYIAGVCLTNFFSSRFHSFAHILNYLLRRRG